MDLGLTGKVIVVTGGGAGIGAGVTRACLAEGARVAVLSRASKNVEEFMAEMKAGGAACALIEARLEDAERCRTLWSHRRPGEQCRSQ
jgi:L-fucose dehydrogenase